MVRKPYASGLTDKQWKLIEDLIPPAKPGGRVREVSMRDNLSDWLSIQGAFPFSRQWAFACV